MLRERRGGRLNFVEADNRFHAGHERIVPVRNVKAPVTPSPLRNHFYHFEITLVVYCLAFLFCRHFWSGLLLLFWLELSQPKWKEKKKADDCPQPKTWEFFGLNGKVCWNNNAIYWSLPVRLECPDLLHFPRSPRRRREVSCGRSFQPLISDHLAPFPPRRTDSYSLGLKVWVPRRFIGAHKTPPCADTLGQTQRYKV